MTGDRGQTPRYRVSGLSRREFLRRSLLLGIGGSALPGLLAACAPQAAPQPQPPAQTSQQPKRGGTLTIVRPIDAVSLDPTNDTTSAGGWIATNIFESLLKLDYDMSLKPWLAERWEQVAPDRWRFYLKQGVKFHDGTDLNAEAVKISVERAISPQSRAASFFRGIKGAEVRDNYTVDIVTDGPYGPLLRAVSTWFMSIVSPAALQKYGQDFGRNPVGTGPFKFVEWRTNATITIERWDGYWGDKAYLDRVIYKVVPEESNRMLALQTGEADMVMIPALAQVAQFKRDNRFVVHEVDGLRVVFFGFNVNRPPVNDVRVRQAMNYAFDRKPVIDNILEGNALPATSLISPGIVGYKDLSQYWAYDPRKAEELMRQAGYTKGSDGFWAKDGQRLTLKHYSPRGRYPKDAEISEAFQAAMRQFGIQIDLQILEWGTLLNKYTRTGLDAELGTLGWTDVPADAHYTLGSLFSCASIPPNGFNGMEYCNPAVDELTARGRANPDEAQRGQLYAQAFEMMAKDAVLVPVYNTKEIIITSAAVKGYRIHKSEYLDWLQYTWLDK